MKGELGMITLEVVIYTLRLVSAILGLIYQVYRLHQALTDSDTKKK